MEDDYYSIESILAENQKIQCTFKKDVPDMGHLDGGKAGDVGLAHPFKGLSSEMLNSAGSRSKP